MDISWKYKHLKPLNYLVVQKKWTDKTKNRENVPNVKVVEVVLVQCSLVVNQHQQKSEVL